MQTRQAGGYPWAGLRLAPTTLRDALQVDLPPEFQVDCGRQPRTLADLDSRAWCWFSAQECHALAELIVTRIREQVGQLVRPGPFADRLLPPMPRGRALVDLNLSVRTHNAMSRSELGRFPESIGSATLDDALNIRQTGAKGIVELLVALEEAGQCATPWELPPPEQLPVRASASPGTGEDTDSPRSAPDAFAGGLSEQDVAALGAWCRGEADSLSPRVLRERLPEIPASTHIDDLAIAPRTAGALSRAGHAQIGSWLQEATIGDILALPSFGRTTLRDLLDGIVRFMLQPPPRQDLTDLAAAIGGIELAASLPGDDPRLGVAGPALCRPGETVRDAADRIGQRPRDPSDLGQFGRHLHEVLATLQRFEGQALEDELIEIAGTSGGRRDGAAFARYRGWDGRGGAVLQVVGDEFGVTRERIRQLCVKVERRVRAVRPMAPALARALALVAEHAPLWAENVPGCLRNAGVTHGTFAPQVLIDAAELLGHGVPFRVETVAGRDRVFLVSDDSAEAFGQLIRLVRRIGRRTVEHWGVGRIQDVARLASEEHGQVVDPAFVEELLREEEGFRWLNQSRGWYWNEEVPRNRLTNQMDKVLCVAARISLAELRVAVARNYRMEGQAPPLDILREFCRQLPNLVIEGDAVRAESPPAPADILAETELLFYETLKARGSVMSRADLEEVCRARGMNRATILRLLGQLADSDEPSARDLRPRGICAIDRAPG